MNTYGDTLDSSLQEIESLRADAARYRWLRDNTVGIWAICVWEEDYDYGSHYGRAGDERYYRDGRSADVVDAAVDAAMAEDKR